MAAVGIRSQFHGGIVVQKSYYLLLAGQVNLCTCFHSMKGGSAFGQEGWRSNARTVAADILSSRQQKADCEKSKRYCPNPGYMEALLLPFTAGVPTAVIAGRWTRPLPSVARIPAGRLRARPLIRLSRLSSRRVLWSGWRRASAPNPNWKKRSLIYTYDVGCRTHMTEQSHMNLEKLVNAPTLGGGMPRVCEPCLRRTGDRIALAGRRQRSRSGSRARVSIPWVLVVLGVSGIPGVSLISRVAGITRAIARIAQVTSVAPLRRRWLAIGIGVSIQRGVLTSCWFRGRNRHKIVSLPHVSWRCSIIGLLRVWIVTTAGVDGFLAVGRGHRSAAIWGLLLLWINRPGIRVASGIRTTISGVRVAIRYRLVTPVRRWSRGSINVHAVLHPAVHWHHWLAAHGYSFLGHPGGHPGVSGVRHSVHLQGPGWH